MLLKLKGSPQPSWCLEGGRLFRWMWRWMPPTHPPPASLPPSLPPPGTNKPAYTGAVLGKGLPASPGAAVGRIVFTAEEAEKWNAEGEKVSVHACCARGEGAVVESRQVGRWAQGLV